MASSFGARHYVELSELKGEISRPPKKLGFHSMEDLLDGGVMSKDNNSMERNGWKTSKGAPKSVVTC